MTESNPPEENVVKEDFRTKQIHELEQLQIVLDENNSLRAKYNALQTQVTPLVDNFGHVSTQPIQQMQNEQALTPEEIESLRTKLEQTLADYRAETLAAGQLNSEIEKMYTTLSSLKMTFRLDQDNKLTAQNKASALTLENFRKKTQSVKETWETERQRLEKQIGFLKKVHESSSEDIKEFEEQMRTNNKGIMHLSSSITIAKEDIRDFTEQLQKIEPKLKEFEELQKKHQQSEVLLVELSDQFESLKKSVETDSLTANVRRQIDYGQKTINEINRQIDKLQCETVAIQEKSRDYRTRITDLETRLQKMKSEAENLENVAKDLAAQKKQLQLELREFRAVYEERGGQNDVISKKIEDGVTLDKQPWEIRKQIISLKNDVRDMENIQKKQKEFEKMLTSTTVTTKGIPQRKRIPMIPLSNQK
ncbi:hypothetical protein TVAG_116860 [Trichomonas vaginalis G3]|uniref:Uncharacterized protein n=1 Tax=Trichomonas vaginalis (strain ATCC PRA-98 / G3) TaxID=412133 RepID=A2FD61_TRIV3|nr:hypothetical protein TVAGG3_1005220 [Trichomonas vaginalis G3]EAX97168.1 hypothetical protein TVAG_116860 [Trichomonas vaginalis G3]KAI5491087.1 hypothetical protein TVAGG3_1005220 [Trichomonas vaginalis G3]|eukprot:XP_001310098.1 hypothetical protein [Trichomonas vaginalis G3]